MLEELHKKIDQMSTEIIELKEKNIELELGIRSLKTAYAIDMKQIKKELNKYVSTIKITDKEEILITKPIYVVDSIPISSNIIKITSKDMTLFKNITAEKLLINCNSIVGNNLNIEKG